MQPSRTVVVAGGAGFLGSHLCDALISVGAKVICLDNLRTGREENIAHLRREPRFEFIKTDVIHPVPNLLAKRGVTIDRIFNLACAASPPHYQADPEHTMLTSVLGTRNLLALADRKAARFLLASTSEVYGDPEVHPQAESYWGHVNPTGPRACYDEGKRAAETLTFDYARADKVKVRVARIFNTYGPRMRADDGRVVSNVVSQALNGDDITVYGSGEQTRSFCYVDDLIAGLMKLMDYEGSFCGAINLGNPVELRVTELVARVIAMTKSRSRVVSRPLPTDDPQRRRPDITLARRLLSWSPEVPLDLGLQRTIAHFAGQKPAAARPQEMVLNRGTAARPVAAPALAARSS